MPRQITKELAKKIAKKLLAEKAASDSNAHDIWVVMEDGVNVASFGIRRGSSKELGHDHIPRDLKIGPRFAKDLANCPKKRIHWIAHMKRLGLIV